jgi:hypothetical protein
MTSEAAIRQLVAFAWRELSAMRLADGSYCVEVDEHEMRPRGRSIRYSVIVALGLLRARASGHRVDADLDQLVAMLLERRAHGSPTPGDLGLLLWLDRRAGGDQTGDLLGALDRALAAAGGLSARDGMEVAWIAIGAAECVSGGAHRAERLLGAARTELCIHRRAASGLLLHRGIGRRRRFPNFATQIYGALALSRIGSHGDEQALIAARGVADTLIGLQQADGAWPWIFDAHHGTVVEPYELYTVHQDAMAPMALLELFDATGDDRYRTAAAGGIEWIYGRNELNRSMFGDRGRVLYRSIRRKSPWARTALYANIASACAGRPLGRRLRTALEINTTDRPYHLGWVLEAWCGRETLLG